MSMSLASQARPRAQSALHASPIYELRNLDVQEADDGLLISGTVDSFYHKQLAQEVVRAVAHGVRLQNTISVRPRDVVEHVSD